MHTMFMKLSPTATACWEQSALAHLHVIACDNQLLIEVHV